MKRVRIGWLAALLMSLAIATPAAAAETFVAGRDYAELPFPQPVETGDKIEVREFFWYGCPHCYSLEPAITAYLKKMPSNAQFIRTPGVAGGWLLHGQAYYTFEALGATEKLHRPFFDAWHVQKRKLHNVENIADFAAEHGVDKTKFKDTFHSFTVKDRLERARQKNVNYRVDSVPLLAVDGRYLTSPSMGGGQERDDAKRGERTMQVVDFLIKKAAKERKK